MLSFTNSEIDKTDPDHFMAILGKRVLHPGGRRSTEELFQRADFQAGQRVLDMGCGVGTTAVEIARHFGVRVTAADISPLMVDRARVNVRQSELGTQVGVEQTDILL